MANDLTVAPTAGASTNTLGITFSTSATIEFVMTPEKIINKSISGIELTAIDVNGVYLHYASLYAFIPWSNIVSLAY